MQKERERDNGERNRERMERERARERMEREKESICSLINLGSALL